MALVLGRRRELVTKTFTASATVPIPQGVSRLESIVGNGAAGSPGTSYPSQRISIIAAEAQAANIVGRGPYSPRTWESLAGDVEALANRIRASPTSGSSASGSIDYTEYLGDGTAFYSYGSVSWFSAMANSVSTDYQIWYSGPVRSYGIAFVSYTRPGGTTAPTTGASATGFGQTFVGGTGGAATSREVKNVAVTPGGSYQVVVPSGGSIVISYYL